MTEQEINNLKIEFQQHNHNGLNSFKVDPVNLFIFTKQVTDATISPFDSPVSGTIRVLFDGTNYVLWIRVNKLWKSLTLL